MSDMIAAMELGGTKTVVALGDDRGRLLEEFRFPTTTPQETMAVAVAWWRERASFDRLGIGSFGPIRVDAAAPDHGTFLTTPKLAWQGFSLVGYAREHLPGVRLFIDTDVQAALLAEMSCGAARGMRDAVYLTVGTGIGAGIASGGRLVHGTLHMEACSLAQGLYAACTLLSPQCLILGGGVSQATGLHEKVARHLDAFANGYFEPLGQRLAAPALGQQAGIIGALHLAMESAC